jgi:tetratricopeptide (TPR) repeat protein
MPDKINTSSSKKKLIVYIVLTIVTLAVYLQANKYDFVIIDDPMYITENHHIQSGFTLDGLAWAFGIRSAAFWHPLTWLSFMLDYKLYGLNAGGYHVTNIILHIISVLLLFWLFNHMTGAIWPSAFVAAFFSLHPLHVESVAWITERKDVLCAFFWMLTLCLYVYYTEKPLLKRYWPVLLSFVCALMSKSMAITLPVIMILLDYWPLSRFRSGIESKKGNLILWQLKEKSPFFLLSVVFSIITFNAQKGLSVEYPAFTLNSRIVNALVSFVVYLEKLLWPHDMTFFYPFINQYLSWQILGAAIIVLFISIAVIVMAGKLPYLFVGWMWYVITIAPVIGIIQISSQAMADRYIYLPSIGISIMLAWGIPLLFRKENIRKKILFPAAIAFLAALALVTYKQCGYWKNSIELLNHALRIRKDVYIVHDCLGLALSAEGKNKEAIGHFNQALSLKPDYAYAFCNRGIVYLRSGQYQEAMGDFNETIRLKPNHVPAYYNRAMVYSQINRYELAIKDYSEGIRLKHDYADAYNNRGAIYLNLGNNGPGCRDAQRACELGVCKVLEIAKSKGDCH